MSDNSNTRADLIKPMAIVVPPDSPKKSVKSTAVVKYSAVQTPATFAQLQCNTNLNLPPSNWLSSSAESYGLQSVWSQNTGFSSFRMAHMFPDCVGEVDVVSDAENIKKLLKLPYNHGVISMMVHRIENTLLIDDFDIHKYLLRQAESDWEWLKKFFYEHIFQNLGDKEKRLFHKANSRNSLQQRNLVSKFLYHSIVLADSKEQNVKPPLPVKPLEQCLPEPTQEEKVPDPNYNHNFARNVVWTFENIQMLIGTDMPIFGGQTHPCISLRLRDMSKPINVLTGIDYWLDNLMCNVPEVVMCYHLHGIVQKYELIKTEDLPNLDDSKFSPKLIRDVAQNILSFLKNNATKAGHTYWLFKGKDDDVVKLYDLTSLCSDVTDEKGQNPFTVPVAMLLYRVARNMKYSSDYHRHQGTIRMLLKNCVQLLAKEKYPQIVTSAHFMLSDLYVPSSTDPVSPGLSDQSDEEDTQSECSTNHDNEKEDDEETPSASIKSLTLANIKEQVEQEGPKYKPPPITGSVEERCLTALEHVAHGLECLKYFPTEENSDEDQKKSMDSENERKKYEEANPNMAKPFQAIPMPYASLNQEKDSESGETSQNNSPSHKRKNKQRKKKSEKFAAKDNASVNNNNNNNNNNNKDTKSWLCKSKNETLPIWQAPKKSDNVSWNAHLKTLLYEKASLIFAVLAENEYANKNYGASLRYILAVLRCQKILEVCCGIRNEKSISCLLGRAGDCCFMTVQDWCNIDDHRKNYEIKNVTEEKIIEEIYSMEDLDTYGIELLPQHLESLEYTLVASYKCYEKALSYEPLEVEKNNLLRRLGNIHNELGVLYMNQAGTRYQNDGTTNESSQSSMDVTNLLNRSLHHLEAGVKAFETVHDEANLALLHSNTGRLMRICAHMHVKHNTQEQYFYNKALANYQKALQVLGTRKSNPAIWDTITWDLSTTLFTMATLLQDFPSQGNKTEEELEREVVDILQKALKHCDVDTPGSRQPVYQFRAAIIQHRLASLYHHIYREFEPDSDNVKRKNSLQLCKLYYDKAAKLLLALEQTTEFLRVQMERVALAEHQARSATTFNGKLKAYQNGLELLLHCRPICELLCEKNKTSKEKIIGGNNMVEIDTIGTNDDEKNVEEQKFTEDDEGLIVLLEQRLQFILRSLTKLLVNKNTATNKKEYETLVNLYKQCYSRALRSGTISGITLITHVAQLLKDLCNILQQIE